MIVTANGLRVSLRDPGTIGFREDRAAFFQVFFAGEYDFLLSRLSPGDTVLDAGANIGCFSLQASRLVGPTGTVVAVEPEPSNAASLRANLRLNDITNVIVVESALDAVAEKIVYVAGTGTMARVASAGIPVRTSSLDALARRLSIQRIDAIKMDIEGSENAIFATPLTSAMLGVTDVIAVEVHDHGGSVLVQDRLRAEGYSHVGRVKEESGFLSSTIRRSLRRPDLVMTLYGLDLAPVFARIVSSRLRKPSSSHTSLVGMIYASR